MRKGAPSKRSQPKGDSGAKPKGACFNCKEMGHYSKDCRKSKSGVGSSKVLALNATLAQKECPNRLMFLKGKISKRDILCLLDIGASHNFITRESAERMELHLEELKAPIEVHFPGLWELITPDCEIRSQRGLNQTCSPCQDISNDISHCQYISNDVSHCQDISNSRKG